MYDNLKRLAVGLGNAIHNAKQSLVREGVDNQRWKEELKAHCLRGIRSGLEAGLDPDIGICFIETPYETSTGGRGSGKNVMRCHAWGAPNAKKTINVLGDIVDGSWNSVCGVPWSASTMVAISDVTEPQKPVDQLTLADFKCGLIVPLVGGTKSPRQAAGFYYGVVGEAPLFRIINSETEALLHGTDVRDVQRTRFFLDLFTAETYESLDVSIDAVKPLIYRWGDIARFYGAGIELMSLLGDPQTTPGFGAYVAANQKADNLIPTTLLLEGAGMIVTSWWGEAIDQMKIMDRMYVAIAANKSLHDDLLRHLSKTPRLI